MIKIALSQDIEQTDFELFHTVCDQLPLNKNEVLSLMIRVFDALPHWFQDELCSKRPGVAERALKKLSDFGTVSASVDTLEEDAEQHRNHNGQTQVPPGVS